MVPIMFLRINTPQAYLQSAMLTGVSEHETLLSYCLIEARQATWVLIVGYSWVDGHLTQFVSPGIGWSVAWRRWVTVVIGAGAAFIMMMTPPTSARKAVRRKNAASIRMLSGVYASLISRWLSLAGPGPQETKSNDELAEELRERVLEIAGVVAATKDLTDLARWEGGIRGHWPHEQYTRLSDVQAMMIRNLAQVWAKFPSVVLI
jgi:hypothetical protein